MGMPFVVCLSLTFHGGETQGESQVHIVGVI